MATREDRVREFAQGVPPDGTSLEILCEDHNGTYVLPFLCHWSDGSWRNAKSGHVIDAQVLGWRARR
jgi:hypothetical protein